MMFGERVYVRPFQIPDSTFQTPDSRFQYIKTHYCKFPVAETHFTANSLTVANLSLQVFSLLKSCCNIGVLFWNSWNLEILNLEIWNLES